MKRLNQEGKKIVLMKEEYLRNFDNEVIKEALIESVKIKTTESVLNVFLNKDEESLIKSLARLKKFQATEMDKFQAKIEEIRTKFDAYNIPYVLVIDESKSEIRIRRFFGLDKRDLPKYFGITKHKKVFEDYMSKSLIQEFMIKRIKPTLQRLAKEACSSFIVKLEDKDYRLKVEISDPYRHEAFTILHNINYDIVIPYNEVDPIKALPIVKQILAFTLREYEI